MAKSKLFFDVVASLDGFIAPEGMDLAHAADPEFKQWLSKGTKLQSWLFQQRFFRENLKLGEDGETGHDNRILEETFQAHSREHYGEADVRRRRTLLA